MTAWAFAPVRVGVIGCGYVSRAYLRNLVVSPYVSVVACADELVERAQERAAEFGIGVACSSDELLSHRDVELVINLTVPTAHAEVTRAAIRAGKHVYSEKPLAMTRQDGLALLVEAESYRVIVGCAPHTFLGGGMQTCLRMMDRGDLGEPLAATAFMFSRGPDNWHPNLAFFYQPGGGPLFDVGPYYLTCLVCLFGPIRQVSGMARILYLERQPDRGPRQGEKFAVTTPTFVASLIEFQSGAQATLLTTFGIAGADLPNMQMYCTNGILGVPDPNTYRGPVMFRSNADGSTWQEVPLLYSHPDGTVGLSALGAIETATAIRAGGRPRASAELAYHVLDVMLSILESASGGRHMEIASTCKRPDLLPLDGSLVSA